MREYKEPICSLRVVARTATGVIVEVTALAGSAHVSKGVMRLDVGDTFTVKAELAPQMEPASGLQKAFANRVARETIKKAMAHDPG